jgi:hypothetical protein
MFISFYSNAQTDTVKGKDEVIINGKHYKAVEEKKENTEIKNMKRQIPLDSEFVIKNNRFRYYNNWLTIGGGLQQNMTYKRSLGFAGGVDFNYHIKHHYLQTGILITGENINFLTNYQIHLGYSKRFEDKDVQFVISVGPTYSTGYAKNAGDTVYSRHYSEPGIYLQGDLIKKIKYDVGIGASLFAEWNPEQTLIGLRLILYFSGSYKGKKHVTYEDSY